MQIAELNCTQWQSGSRRFAEATRVLIITAKERHLVLGPQ
jgi:hypothetical protein